MHELLELMSHCFDHNLFICRSTNDVDVVGLDSCKEAARLWECKISCDLLDHFCFFWKTEVCEVSCFPVDMIDLGDEHAQSGGEDVFQGAKSTDIAPVFMCGDWSVNNEVVQFIIVDALFRTTMFGDDKGTLDIEVVGDNVFKVEAHCL